MQTKLKGDIGELKVMLYLQERGYNISIPFGDRCRYDIVAEKGGIFKRIQVKYVSAKKGKMEISLQSNTKVGGKYRKTKYTSKDIDEIYIYCPQKNSIYMVPIIEVEGMTMVTLRLSKPHRKDKKIRYAYHYLMP